MKILTAALVLLAMQSPFGESIEVRLHNLDVIVTDREGKPVTGLRQEDFEVLEDGVPQKITNFAEYGATGFSPSNTERRAEARPASVQAPPPRRFVFFVDEMAIHPNVRTDLAKRSADLLDRIMREGDQGMLVRPVISGKVTHAFTSDRAALRGELTTAIADNEWAADVAFRGEMMRFQSDARNAVSLRDRIMIARRHAARVKRRVEQRLSYLRGIVASLAPLPGRKVLVIITESLPTEPGREFFPGSSDLSIVAEGFDAPSDVLRTDHVDLTPAIEELARTASANGITIYAVQPELDLAVAAPGGDDGTSLTTAQRALSNTGRTLSVLADKTGGRFYVGAARVDDAFAQLTADVTSYYSMAYRAGPALDRPHHVVVRVKNRPELNVRARNDVVRKSATRDMTDRVVAGLVYAGGRNDLGIIARAGDPERAKQRRAYTVDVDVGIPLGKLTFIRDGNVHRGKFTVHYAVTGKESEFVSGVEPEQVVEIPAAEFAAARSKIWRHTLSVTAEKGTHEVAVGVLDGVSQESGIVTLSVNVK